MKYSKPKHELHADGVSPQPAGSLIPWQPSTWPEAPPSFDGEFLKGLRRIFKETMLDELRNVIEDVVKSHGSLEHRGHVIAIPLLCAVDAIASYGYRGTRYQAFVANHFPPEYRPFAGDLYQLYRNSFVHSWNLFEVAILPGHEPIQKYDGSISFGLLHFWSALEKAVEDFFDQLATQQSLQTRALARYRKLRASARP